MGKKSKKADLTTEIYDYFVVDCIENENKLIQSLPLLIDNGRAIKLSGSYYTYTTNNTCQFNLACKLIIKYDKSYKVNIKTDDLHAYDQFMPDKIYADENSEVAEIKKICLDFGKYIVKMDKYDYAFLNVEPVETNHGEIKFDLYFIGDNFSKYKDRFLDKCKKYENKRKASSSDYLILATDRPVQKEAIFKPFDKMVIRDKSRIIKYIDNWVDNIPSFYERGIPCRLTILLYGSPGTGKSTLCRALAKYLGIKRVILFSPGYFNDNDNCNLSYYTNRNSEPAVFSIDDLDCICKSRKEDSSIENTNVLSTLLEFLDNPPTTYFKAKDGKYYPISILVATTNYYDKLDDAVKRYGRFDFQLEMTNFNYDEATEMAKLYNVNIDTLFTGIDKENFSISPAQMQALCIENIDNALKSI
jgi:AAA+ superfamily predicted ATPase